MRCEAKDADWGLSQWNGCEWGNQPPRDARPGRALGKREDRQEAVPRRRARVAAGMRGKHEVLRAQLRRI